MAVFQVSHAVQPLGSFPMAFAISACGAQFGIGIFMATALVAFAAFGAALDLRPPHGLTRGSRRPAAPGLLPSRAC